MTLNAAGLVPVLVSETTELTIASGAMTIVGMEHTVSSESGTSDTLDTINLNSTLLSALLGLGMLLLLTAKTGHTITLTHQTGSTTYGIKTTDERDFVMTENKPALLRFNPVSTQWNMIGGISAPALASADYSSGAISIKSGIAWLTGAGATTYTLADPATGTDDNKELTIMSTTAQAHKVDNSAGSGFNGGGGTVDFANFTGNVGDSITLFARAGKWYVQNLTNVTIAAS